LYLGSTVVASHGAPSVGLRIRGKPVLSFPTANDAVSVSADVSSPDGQRIVVMRDNYFRLHEYFRKQQDTSTLDVFDETNSEPVLHVRYANRHAIVVTGTFSYDGVTVIVGKDLIRRMDNGQIIARDCMAISEPGITGVSIK
jgi:hypothetical protein